MVHRCPTSVRTSPRSRKAPSPRKATNTERGVCKPLLSAPLIVVLTLRVRVRLLTRSVRTTGAGVRHFPHSHGRAGGASCYPFLDLLLVESRPNARLSADRSEERRVGKEC